MTDDADDNSTIRTLDTLFDGFATKNSSALSSSQDSDKAGKRDKSSSSKKSCSARSSSRLRGKQLEDDKSRSGRSTSSKSSRSSETPTTKNLSSALVKSGQKKAILISEDENVRVTRSSKKRQKDTGSQSSGESQNKQVKKYICID